MQGIVDWEDLDIFFDEFAVEATLELGNGDTLSLSGIFDTPYQKRDFGAFVVDAEDPSFTCKWTAELENARAGDKLTIKGEAFYIESAPQSDGTGLASFTLTRASTQDAEGDDFSQTPGQSQSPQSGNGGSNRGGLFGSG